MTQAFEEAAERILASTRAGASSGWLTFADALAATGSSSSASHALFYLVLHKRLAKADDQARYEVLSAQPVSAGDWSDLDPGRFAQPGEAPAESQAWVETVTKTNERGYFQAAIQATCQASMQSTHAWGTSERSAKRALIELTEECPCGSRWHKAAEPELWPA